jgi:hypothetical protein
MTPMVDNANHLEAGIVVKQSKLRKMAKKAQKNAAKKGKKAKSKVDRSTVPIGTSFST